MREVLRPRHGKEALRPLPHLLPEVLLFRCEIFISTAVTEPLPLLSWKRYYLSKQYVPIDIEFMVSDALESLRPKLQRYQTYEEAVVEVFTSRRLFQMTFVSCNCIPVLAQTEKVEKEEEANYGSNHYPKGPLYVDQEIRLDSYNQGTRLIGLVKAQLTLEYL